MLGKLVIVLLASESLLLGRRDDIAVANETGGAVVVEGRNAKDVHLGPKIAQKSRFAARIIERNGRARGEEREKNRESGLHLGSPLSPSDVLGPKTKGAKKTTQDLMTPTRK
jgi:hypothetical protein